MSATCFRSLFPPLLDHRKFLLDRSSLCLGLITLRQQLVLNGFQVGHLLAELCWAVAEDFAAYPKAPQPTKARQLITRLRTRRAFAFLGVPVSPISCF